MDILQAGGLREGELRGGGGGGGGFAFTGVGATGGGSTGEVRVEEFWREREGIEN